MTKYVMLDTQNRPRRISPTKPHPSALPVEYPDISNVDRVTHEVQQEPIHKWMVENDKVTVVYSIRQYDVATQKTKMIDRARQRRKEAEVAGITVNGIDIRTTPNSQARVSGLMTTVLADQNAGSFDFEHQPAQWVTIDRATAFAIGKAVSDHVQAGYTNQRQLQSNIEAAQDMYDLQAIDLSSGWPGDPDEV